MKAFDSLCGSQQTVETYKTDGSTQTTYLFPEKPV